MTAPKVRPLFCPKCGGTDFTDANNCRPCHRARVLAYMESQLGQAFKERNKPHKTAYNKGYWLATKADVQAKAEEDRAAGRPTDAAAKAAKYKANHPNRLAASQAKFYATEKGIIYKWANTASNAIRKRHAGNGPTTATLRELWRAQSGICPLTLRPMQMSGTGYHLDAPSLDRLDQSLGYVASNVRLVTVQANSARGSGTDEHLYDFCKAALAHRDKLKT